MKPVLRRPVESTQYTSLAFGKRCKESRVRPSMGSVGDAYDNAMCESFFATLECELLNRRRFKTQTEARMAVFEFIEGFYNPRRRHSALGYLSPNAYEALTLHSGTGYQGAVLAPIKEQPILVRDEIAVRATAVLDRSCARQLAIDGGRDEKTNAAELKDERSRYLIEP
jgi:putative transposase